VHFINFFFLIDFISYIKKMSYTRVNGDMLTEFKGRNVCLMGKLKKVKE
jgi:hypothetical protein